MPSFKLAVLLLLFLSKKMNHFVSGDATVRSDYLGLHNDYNFGHSGYVYLPSEPNPPPALEISKCQNYDVNKTICSLLMSIPKNASDLTVLKAWTAVTLRDNIVTLLGFMLHRTNNTFSQEIYSSLYFLYQEVRKHNIKTMDLLPHLKNLPKNSRTSQVIGFFKIFHNVLPPYCKHIVEQVVKYFAKSKDRLKDAVLSESKNETGFGLLRDIHHELLSLLRMKGQAKNIDKQVEAFFGREFAVFFADIVNDSIRLTQPVFAALLLNMRFDIVRPDESEDLRYLADILRDGNVKNWEPMLTISNRIQCPYVLVKTVLIKLVDMNADSTISGIAEKLLPRLQKPPDTFVNPNYAELVPFFGTPQLNVTLLLEDLDENPNNHEVNSLRELITEGKFDVTFALKGFIRYYYDSYRDLSVALMNRIRNRVPMTNLQRIIMKNLTDGLFASYRNAKSEKQRRALKGTTIMQDISVLEGTIVTSPQGKDRIWDALRGSTFFDLCESPRNCLNEILNNVLSIQPKPNKTITPGAVSPSTTMTTTTTCQDVAVGTPLSTWLRTLDGSASESVAPSTLVRGVSAVLDLAMNSSDILERVKSLSAVVERNDTERDRLKRVLRGMLSLKEVRALPIVYYETIRIYCVLVHGINESMMAQLARDTTLDLPPLSKVTGKLIYHVSPTVGKLLDDENVTRSLSGITPKDYTNRRALLSALFKRLLTLESVKRDSKLFDEIVRLLHSIQTLAIDYTDLLKTVDVGTIDDEIRVNLVFDFLTRPNLMQILGQDFDVGRYRTKGSMLKGILKTALKTTAVRDDTRLSSAIESILPKIDCTHVGAEIIERLHPVGVMNHVVHLYKVMAGAIDTARVTPEVERAFSNMHKWYGGTFDPLEHVRYVSTTLYDTRAEFLAGFYENLEKTVRENAAKMIRDIETMKSVILTTGSGAEPVDYV